MKVKDGGSIQAQQLTAMIRLGPADMYPYNQVLSKQAKYHQHKSLSTAANATKSFMASTLRPCIFC